MATPYFGHELYCREKALSGSHNVVRLRALAPGVNGRRIQKPGKGWKAANT